MKAPDFRHMSPEDFELFRASTEEEFDAYRDESEFRKWCKEFNEHPLDPDTRAEYDAMKEELGERFWQNPGEGSRISE